MANLNKCLLIGNLTRDPEVRYTPKGTAVCDLGLAINRVLPTDESGERREETVFVDVTLWGRQAEVAQQYLIKGRPVFIEGRLHLEQWDDKQTGQKRSKLKVVGEHLQLLGGARSDNAPVQPEPSPSPARQAPAPTQTTKTAAPVAPAPDEGFATMPYDPTRQPARAARDAAPAGRAASRPGKSVARPQARPVPAGPSLPDDVGDPEYV